MYLIELKDNLVGRFTDAEIEKIHNFVEKMTTNTVITLPRFMEGTGLDRVCGLSVLEYLRKNAVLKKQYALRCADCGLIVKTANDIGVFDSMVYCYKCEKPFECTTEDIEEIYILDEQV